MTECFDEIVISQEQQILPAFIITLEQSSVKDAYKQYQVAGMVAAAKGAADKVAADKIAADLKELQEPSVKIEIIPPN